MTADYLNYFSMCVFGGAILLIIYLVYSEWKKAQIEAEQDEIEMKELENENTINSASDATIVNDINKECESGQSSGTNKPK